MQHLIESWIVSLVDNATFSAEAVVLLCNLYQKKTDEINFRLSQLLQLLNLDNLTVELLEIVLNRDFFLNETKISLKKFRSIFNSEMVFPHYCLSFLLSYFEEYFSNIINTFNQEMITTYKINNLLSEKQYKEEKGNFEELYPYIYIVCRQLYPEMSLPDNSFKLLSKVIVRIMLEILFLSKTIAKKILVNPSITRNIIKCSLVNILDQSLLEHALFEIEKANDNYTRYIDDLLPRTKKAKITFDVKVISEIYQRFFNFKISVEAEISLSIILEYLTAEIIELSGRYVLSNKIEKENIISEFLDNPELNSLIDRLNFKISEHENIDPLIETLYTNIPFVWEEDENIDIPTDHTFQRLDITETYILSREITDLEKQKIIDDHQKYFDDICDNFFEPHFGRAPLSDY